MKISELSIIFNSKLGKTLAKWLGHQDGGILVGRVYGHLSDEHQKAMARRLSDSTTSIGIENPSAFRIA